MGGIDGLLGLIVRCEKCDLLFKLILLEKSREVAKEGLGDSSAEVKGGMEPGEMAERYSAECFQKPVESLWLSGFCEYAAVRCAC